MYLDEVVDEVVKAARVLASTRDVSIEAATVPSAALAADEDLVRRLIVNLLDNAIRYAPPGSVVRVDLEHAPADMPSRSATAARVSLLRCSLTISATGSCVRFEARAAAVS